MPCFAMVCYGMAWFAMLCYGMLWHGMLCYGMLCYGMTCYGMLCYGMLCHGMLWYAMLWYALVWYALVWYGLLCFAMVWYVCIALFFFHILCDFADSRCKSGRSASRRSWQSYAAATRWNPCACTRRRRQPWAMEREKPMHTQKDGWVGGSIDRQTDRQIGAFTAQKCNFGFITVEYRQ